MANNRINKYLGAMAFGTVLLAVPACTDVWDDHYNAVETNPQATTTLWEQISEDKNLSKFAAIAQKANYWKDETHAVKGYTFDKVLQNGQVVTAWIPDNSMISDAELAKWLDMCETDGYAVQQQFIGNHVALWRHNLSGEGVDTVKMINGKNLIFDKNEHTLQGIKIVSANQPAVNGVIHTLAGTTPFRYNFYEHMKYGTSLPMLRDYVISKDTTYFYANSSIEGLPDENGKPTYVDSVYFTTNRLLEYTHYLPANDADKWLMREEGFGARINQEDSMFIMVMPTDDAWTAAKIKLKDYYKYAPAYEDKIKSNQGTSTLYLTKIDADSLSEMSLNMDIISPLVFNVNKQPKIKGDTKLWTLDRFIESKGAEAEYLLNTYGDTLRNTTTWDKTSLFNGELVQMSNGYGYEATEWNFPSMLYKPDVEVEIEHTGNFYQTSSSTKYKVGGASDRMSFNNTTFQAITEKYGKVSNNNFYYLQNPGATSTPHVEIKLEGNSASAYVPGAQVMSGKYDIQLVMVPQVYLNLANAGFIEEKYWINDTTYIYTILRDEDGFPVMEEKLDEEGNVVLDENGDPVMVPVMEKLTDSYGNPYMTIKRHVALNEEYINSIAANNKFKFKTTISYNNGATTGKDATSKAVTCEYDGLKVDTITVVEDFEFPYSYKNMRYSYPTLILDGATSKTDAKNGFVYHLLIDKIILRSKENKEEIVLDPK